MDILKLFRPGECVASVTSIDLDGLERRGIRALLMDLDNTLVRWQSSVISAEVEEWVKAVVNRGFKVCIVSNTRSRERLRQLAEQLGVSFVRRGCKPRRGGFREALDLLGVERTHAAVIGDQIFTDILGGNRMGLHTVLVRPIHPHEFIGTRISRIFEKLLLRSIVREDSLVSKKLDSRDK